MNLTGLQNCETLTTTPRNDYMDDNHHLLVEDRVRVLAEAGTRALPGLPGSHTGPLDSGTKWVDLKDQNEHFREVEVVTYWPLLAFMEVKLDLLTDH